jgi:RNA polymerase sigma-70 factor (ECF subfamily)
VDPLTSLLLAAKDGDRHALDQFVRRTQHDVWALCRNLGDVDTAEDLVQETYARAMNSLERYRAEGPARNWLLTIARRTCADATRQRIRARQRRSNESIDDQAYEAPDTTVVDELLAALDDDRREAFVLTQLAGCSYAEAAEIIGCPIGTVRSRVARARSDLIPLLETPPETKPGLSQAPKSAPTQPQAPADPADAAGSPAQRSTPADRQRQRR